MARTNKYTSINFNEIYEKKAASTTANGSSPSPVTGRYTSLSSATKSYSFSAATRSHGMLVLSRPSPKPASHPKPPPQTQTQTQPQPLAPAQPQSQPQSRSPVPPPSARPRTPPSTLPDHPGVDSESISLRPLGKTGSVPLISSPPPSSHPTNLNPEREKDVVSPKTDKFVPNPEREKDVVSPVTSLPKTDKFVPPHLRPGFVPKEGRPATPPGVTGGKGRDLGGHRHVAVGSPPNRYVDYRNGAVGSPPNRYGDYRHGAVGSPPNRYGDDRRPKSGSGYEKMIGRRGGGGGFGGGGGGGHEFGPGEMNRPRSGGSRPGSSG